ncbi:hypothetical protein HF086_018221 [Spodoptera exigua]|uniref:YqaJ viral recombinase domain-containing protein n=1 Tax=Spodoptera exigua TaxID=7107 RepID=A0A922SJB7_SPOEX|nr:hypothetical protein HF086_018221 [Spodoptera exigua]
MTLASTAPNISPHELKKAEVEFLNNLRMLTSDRQAIERATVLQRDSSEWYTKLYLTCVTAVAHGIEHERQALQQLEKQENITILPCGLFIDRTYPFIRATPDGLVGDDTLIEIKCPLTAVKKVLPVQYSITS